MIKKTTIILLFIIAGGIFLLPELGICLRRDEAFRVAEVLKPRMIVRYYNPASGNRRWQNVNIKRVQVIEKNSDYHVVINGSVINPGHFYIKIHGNWVNVAMLVGIEVKGVPEFLPESDRTP